MSYRLHEHEARHSAIRRAVPNEGDASWRAIRNRCFVAVWLVISHERGIAGLMLARGLGVTQKSAWFMLHRLRHVACTQLFDKPLDGEIEIDKLYVGDKSVVTVIDSAPPSLGYAALPSDGAGWDSNPRPSD